MREHKDWHGAFAPCLCLGAGEQGSGDGIDQTAGYSGRHCSTNQNIWHRQMHPIEHMVSKLQSVFWSKWDEVGINVQNFWDALQLVQLINSTGIMHNEITSTALPFILGSQDSCRTKLTALRMINGAITCQMQYSQHTELSGHGMAVSAVVPHANGNPQLDDSNSYKNEPCLSNGSSTEINTTQGWITYHHHWMMTLKGTVKYLLNIFLVRKKDLWLCTRVKKPCKAIWIRIMTACRVPVAPIRAGRSDNRNLTEKQEEG